MTSPTGGEHISRYRALGEFDNLIREANKAKRALRELREEEAKLNAQSIADDKKVAASKAERAKAEEQNRAAAKKSIEDLGKNNAAADKAGEDTGRTYTRGMGKGIQKETQSGGNKQFLSEATKALQQAFANAGAESGASFASNAKNRIGRESRNLGRTPEFDQALKDMREKAGTAGTDTGNRYIMGFASKIKNLNNILHLVGFDELDLDVDIKDAEQSIKALEFELTRLSHVTSEPRVRIDTSRALVELRAIQKLFKDEVAEDMIKESRRIQDELKILDNLPSGKAFKFWTLTALSDMSRVFSEADRGASVFEKLRKAITASGSGGGGNYFKTVITGFDDFSEASSNLLQRLGRVSGELYRMPGLIGVLVAAIPALVAGVGALGGGALGAASALGSLTGFAAAAPGIFAAFGTAIFAIKVGVGGLGDIFKQAAKAQAEQAEEQEKMRLGTDKALTATQKYKLALGQLSENTQKVIGTLVELQKPLNIIKEDVGEEFFGPLAKDTGLFNDALKIMSNLLKPAAAVLGQLADQGLKMLTSGPWTRDFQTISKNNVTFIDNMGKSLLSLITAFKNIAIAAGPFTTWVTGALKDGAKSFADWSAQARSDGTIQSFLEETSESGQILWQILKNLGNVVNSFFKSTVDEGQTYLRTLENITGHWADVAKAQESANSPLRTWMVQIRPILSSLGALIRDLARGIGDLASNQSSITNMVSLLDSLRTRVLPPILEILQHLNDSGIAVTVVDALGTLLEAIAKFLDSGATTALSVFVTVLANFAEIVFSFASLPVISNLLGGLAAALAAVAAVSVVARFTGLFKLWDFFTWMVRNKGNLSGAFADAARGAAGLSQVGGQQVLPKIPSTVSNIGGVGSEVIEAQAKAIERVGDASNRASGKVGIFSRALGGISSAGGAAKSALGNLSGFLGGPWGIAITAATIGIGLLASHLADQKREAEDTKNAFLALKNAYTDLKAGNTDAVSSLAETDDKLKQIIQQSETYGLSLTDVSGALNNQEQSLSRFNTQIDTQINGLKAQKDAIIEDIRARGVQTGEIGDGTEALTQQIEKAEDYKNQVNNTASAQQKQNAILRDSTSLARTYEQRLAGMTQEQVNNAVEAGRLDGQIRTLSSALDTLSSATASTSDRSRALSDIINHEKGEMMSANEAAESFETQMLTLEDSVKSNGKSLSLHTREGLRNRDALEAAAGAARDLYLEDIASGKPMNEATKRHKERIDALKEEAKRLGLNKTETQKLIDTYGDVPEDLKTDIKTDTKGFQQVYADLLRLQVIQNALKEGKSPEQAERDWVNESSKLYRRPPTVKGSGDGPGFATGGPVWGAGTRTSDSIQAWLSNGEFVQPTDAVEHYGLPVMEALRKRKLDKSVIAEALPDANNATFASGGHAHASNCEACASGGHKFAQGGQLRIPIVVDPRKTLVDKDWATAGVGDLGGSGGGNGWKWQMQVLRQRFPGLPLISGYRPGSRTLSGNRSYHSVGRAVDLPPRRDVAQWIRSTYGARTKELITPYNDLNLHNGKPHRYTGAIWNQHNFAGGNAHDHWAFKQGGLVDLMNMMGMDNLAPQKQAPLPSTPRSLSPAASSVVNNSTDNARTFGDVIINNPLPERAGDSIRDSLYRTQMLL